MSDLHQVPARVRDGSTSSIQTLDEWRQHWMAASNDPDGYWLEIARSHVHWRTPPTVGLEGGYQTVADAPFKWFSDGTLNITESCLDRHLHELRDKTAIIWEADEPGEDRYITFKELHEEVCKAANALKALGVKKGDPVILYMGMVPEAAVAMLACARIGAIHSVVFGGFSADSLRDRIIDSGAKVVITQDQGLRGSKPIPLKDVADKAMEGQDVRHALVYRRTGGDVGWTEGRDVWWHDVVDGQSDECEAEEMAAEDPLFILYTSGSTGKPKGLVHTSGGYLTWVTWTCATTFDLRPDDVYACVADVGWITGHSYIVYGPLSNGTTSLMFESIPTYPDASRYWDLVERHKVTVFYTAPTAIRALAAYGPEPVRKHDLSSLRVLGTVGEPINPDAWEWYFHVVGKSHCTIVDTWWQTETGGHCITPIAPATPTKPGSATYPLPGIQLELVDSEGRFLTGPAEGRMCIRHPWPGQARTVWGDHARYVDVYFSQHPPMYFTGDGARRDADGYWWITGRVDDVINVSGHRMGTAEFESVIVHDEAVAEAAVVGYPHPVKGQGVYAYVVMQPGEDAGEDLQGRLNALCRKLIGAHARIDKLQIVPGLPKTRSGKVMRRILRKVAEGQPEALGDISTLADSSVVQAIIDGAHRD